MNKLALGFIVGALLASASMASSAAEGYDVTELRSDKVALYEKRVVDGTDKFEKVGEVKKEEFNGPWSVLSNSGTRLEVKIKDKNYWVATYAVQTNKPVNAPADCGAVVTYSGAKYGVQRGLGEACKK